MSTETAAAEAEILTERRGAVLWVTFNRPSARNAMTWWMYDRILTLCDEIDADPLLRAVVFTGAGEKAFVAGTDISQFRNFSTADDVLGYEARVDRVYSRVEDIKIPTIAAIKGACTGGGAGFASVCDVRIASPSSKFGFPVARTLGNCLSIKNLSRLVSLIGATRVKEMVFTARLFTAAEAYAGGFLNEVAPDEGSLLPRADELSQTIAGNAPLTIRATKEALRRLARSSPPPDGSDLITACYLSNDFREGIEAFFAKRPANWTGT
ncbi:MAG: enoyl-CoA hydratase/isomerase family protein [Candidatus Baltobacteraceae bacterium]